MVVCSADEVGGVHQNVGLRLVGVGIELQDVQPVPDDRGSPPSSARSCPACRRRRTVRRAAPASNLPNLSGCPRWKCRSWEMFWSSPGARGQDLFGIDISGELKIARMWAGCSAPWCCVTMARRTVPPSATVLVSQPSGMGRSMVGPDRRALDQRLLDVVLLRNLDGPVGSGRLGVAIADLLGSRGLLRRRGLLGRRGGGFFSSVLVAEEQPAMLSATVAIPARAQAVVVGTNYFPSCCGNGLDGRCPSDRLRTVSHAVRDNGESVRIRRPAAGRRRRRGHQQRGG